MSKVEHRIHRALRGSGLARSRDLEAAGLSRTEISRRVGSGELIRVARGLYALPDRDPGEHESLIEVAKRAPRVVFCLLTALRVHELTTQAPHEIWIAIGNKDHPPRIVSPRIRAVRFSAASLSAGIDTKIIDETAIRVTCIAKTVADCFKFRNTVGLDVALEALREARRRHGVSVDEIWHFAKIDRVANVMRPYLEALA